MFARLAQAVGFGGGGAGAGVGGPDQIRAMLVDAMQGLGLGNMWVQGHGVWALPLVDFRRVPDTEDRFTGYWVSRDETQEGTASEVVNWALRYWPQDTPLSLNSREWWGPRRLPILVPPQAQQEANLEIKQQAQPPAPWRWASARDCLQECPATEDPITMQDLDQTRLLRVHAGNALNCYNVENYVRAVLATGGVDPMTRIPVPASELRRMLDAYPIPPDSEIATQFAELRHRIV